MNPRRLFFTLNMAIPRFILIKFEQVVARRLFHSHFC